MAQHRDPHFRPGRGKLCDIITLSNEAERAFRAWGLIYGERVDIHKDPATARTRIDHAHLEAALAEERGTLRGELLQLAVVDGQSRPVTDEIANSIMAFAYVEWDVARMLASAERAFTPKPAPVVVDDKCRHGVAYSADCSACEEDAL